MTEATVPETAESAVASARDYPTKAIWALVLSCMGVLMPVIGIAGLALGVIALRGVDRDGGRGRSFALAAVVVGLIDVVVVVLGVLFMLNR